MEISEVQAAAAKFGLDIDVLAARGTRAAVGDAGDRIRQQRVLQRATAARGCTSTEAETRQAAWAVDTGA